MTIYNDMDLILFKEFFRDHHVKGIENLNEEEFKAITKFISMLTEAKENGLKNVMYDMAKKQHVKHTYAKYFDEKQEIFNMALKIAKKDISI